MSEVKISHDEIIQLAQAQLPKLLAEVFERSYSNPLKDALDDVLKGEEFKVELKKIVLECYQEVSKEVDFKMFVKESIVNKVVKELQTMHS